MKKIILGLLVSVLLLTGVYQASASPVEETITRTLMEGMKGSDVSYLQSYLGVPVDGYYGPETIAKVKNWQRQNNLIADGMFGPGSIKKLISNKNTGSVLGVTTDTTPRIMYWYGKVNQHIDSNGVWQSDPDGSSGANIEKLTYCKKFWPNTLSVEPYMSETITTWKAGLNTITYTGTQVSDKCVQPAVNTEPIEGQWTPWTNSGSCVKSTSGDYQKQVRSCNDPSNSGLKVTCSGSATQNISCSTTPLSCSDSDGGLNYSTNGTITGPLAISGSPTSDMCVGANDLRELFCNTNGVGEPRIYTCPNGCSNGACVASIPVPTCSISSFKVSPSTIVKGQSATISWNTSNCGALSIASLGTVTGPSGSKVVYPTTNTGYALIAMAQDGRSAINSETKMVTVTEGTTLIPTATITVPDCVIKLGDSSCSTQIKWNVTNPKAGASYKVITSSPVNHSTVQTLGVGTSDLNYFYPYSITYQKQVFAVVDSSNTSQPLATVSPTATCATGTIWNGSSACVLNNTSTPSITVLSPNGGELYSTGQKITVKWKSENIPTNAKIAIYLEEQPTASGGSSKYSITNGELVANDGEESVILYPYLNRYGKYFKIYITYTIDGVRELENDSSDNTFTILPLPVPVIKSPCAPYGDVDYDGYLTEKDNTLITQKIGGVVSFTAEQIKRADVNKDGNISVMDIALIKNFMSGASNTFPVCTVTPSITVLSPNGGETYNAGKQITVKWKSENFSSSYNVVIQLMDDISKIDYKDNGRQLFTVNDGEATFTIPVDDSSGAKLIGGKRYKIGIWSGMNEGYPNLSADWSDNTFTINNITNPICSIDAGVVKTYFGDEKNSTWGFYVKVTNPNSSKGWTTNFEGYTPVVTAYGTTKLFGNFNINSGPLKFTAKDTVDSNCSYTITVYPPSVTLDPTPRIMYWSGKVNQHVDASGNWQTDSDGASGSNIDKLTYCKKFWPNTTSVESYKTETINTWRAVGNTGAYSTSKTSYKCVQGNTFNSSIAITSPYGRETFTIGEKIEIKWTTLNIPNNAPMYVSVSDGINTPVAVYTENDGYELFTLSSNLKPGTAYRVVVKMGANSKIATESSAFTLISADAVINLNYCSVGMLTQKLWRGISGSQVKSLQSILASLDYLEDKDIDGSFGKGTRSAVMAFQLENGLMADGIVGLGTRNALNTQWQAKCIGNISNTNLPDLTADDVDITPRNGKEKQRTISANIINNSTVSANDGDNDMFAGGFLNRIEVYSKPNGSGSMIDSYSYLLGNLVDNSEYRISKNFNLENGSYSTRVCADSNSIVKESIESNNCSNWENFGVGESTPSITVTSPNTMETFRAGDIMKIRWNSSNLSMSDKVRISIIYNHTDNTYNANETIDDWIMEEPVYNTGYYDWKIPGFYSTGMKDSNFKIKISKDNINDYSDTYFRILQENTGNDFSVSGPKSGYVYRSGDLVNLSWTKKEDSSYMVSLLKKNDPSFSIFSLDLLYPSSDKYQWKVLESLSEGEYYFKVNQGPLRSYVGYSDSFIIKSSNLPNSISQSIPLKAGWNIISFNVKPTDLSLKSMLLSMSPINGEIIQNEDGVQATYMNGSWSGGFSTIDTSKGYKVKVSKDKTLTISGTPISTNTNIPLRSGTNLVPYYPTTEMNAATVFSSVGTCLKKVMDESGNVYEDWGVFGGWKNNIGTLKPGEGYTVITTCPASLNYSVVN